MWARLRTPAGRAAGRAFAAGNIDEGGRIEPSATGFKMILMENELDLLKQLKSAGERGRTIRTFDTRLRLERLVKVGYVASQATGLELVHYRITKRGEDALRSASLLI
jgi:hypothetical protein